VTTLGWLALATATVAMPGPTSATARAGALASRGRLGALPRPGSVGARHVRWAPVLVGLLAAPVAVVWWWDGPVLGAAAAAIVGVGHLVGRDSARRRAAVARAGELLAAVRLLVAELEAGSLPAAALVAAAELAPQFALPLHEAAVASAGAGDAAGPLLRNPATVAIGSAWQLGEQAGIPLAGVLDRVAQDLGADAEHRRSVTVALAGPRASAFVLAGLPLLGIALGAALGARPWAFLLGTGPGRAVCCVGVLLDAAGIAWMRAILHRAERA
jgi:tight adherence protein B